MGLTDSTPTSSQETIVLDSDVTISLIKMGLINTLSCLSPFRFHITDVNYSEITYQRSILDRTIANGVLEVTPILSIDGLTMFGELAKFVDPGEASAIALAYILNARIALHDKAGRRAAMTKIDSYRVLDLQDLLVQAIRVDCLAPHDAMEAAVRLRDLGDYVLPYLEMGIEAAIGDSEIGIHPRGISQ